MLPFCRILLKNACVSSWLSSLLRPSRYRKRKTGFQYVSQSSLRALLASGVFFVAWLIMVHRVVRNWFFGKFEFIM